MPDRAPSLALPLRSLATFHQIPTPVSEGEGGAGRGNTEPLRSRNEVPATGPSPSDGGGVAEGRGEGPPDSALGTRLRTQDFVWPTASSRRCRRTSDRGKNCGCAGRRR